jgi:hypothetical protein
MTDRGIEWFSSAILNMKIIERQQLAEPIATGVMRESGRTFENASISHSSYLIAAHLPPTA